jgi:hypothetical protein
MDYSFLRSLMDVQRRHVRDGEYPWVDRMEHNLLDVHHDLAEISGSRTKGTLIL